MRKRIILAVLLIFTLLFCACSDTDQSANENLLNNPGFEKGTGVDAEGWHLERYDSTSPVENYQVISDAEGPEGENVIKIESVQMNDARFIQEVQVEPESYYRLSAWVKTELVQSDIESGASIGIFDSQCRSQYISGNTDWTQLVLYGETGGDTETVTVALRLGYYGADASGIAYFDNVCLERIENLPEGATALSMDTVVYSTPQQEEDVSKNKNPDDVIVNVTVFGIILFLVFSAFLIWAYKELNFKMYHLFIFAGVALIIRFVAASMYAGFLVDIKCFAFWGNTMKEAGMADFYLNAGFCDYPPLYMVVLGIFNSIASLFGVEIAPALGGLEHAAVLPEGAGAALIFLKSPAIICDVLSAVLIALIAKKHVGEKLAVILGIGYAFLPTAIVNSGLWGQVDSVLVLFMLLTFWLIDKDQFGFSVLTYFVGLLLKPQAILFGPVMLLVAIHEFYVIYLDFSDGNSEKAWWRLGKGFGALFVCIGVFFLLSSVMDPGEAYMKQNEVEGNWLLGLYTKTLGSYDFATLSSFGLMGLLGGQWKESSLEVMDGVTYGDLGTALLYIVIALVVGVFAFLLYRAIDNNSKGRKLRRIPTGWFWVLGALMVAGAVTVSTRTHERYMFPVIFMLVMGFVHFKDYRLLIISGGYALLNYVNTAGLMFLYEESGVYFANSADVLPTETTPISATIFDIGSFLTVALFVFQIYVTINLMLKKDYGLTAGLNSAPKTRKQSRYSQPVQPETPLTKLFKRRSYRLPKVTWQAVGICLLITAVYSVFAFNNLGDVKAAENFWYAEKSEVYAVADLGEVKEFDSIKYLSYSNNGAISNGAVKVYLSDDGENYTSENIVAINYDDEWQELHGSGKARFIKLAVASNMASEVNIDGVNIREIVVLKDNVPLEIKEVSESVVPSDNLNGAASNLFDAQESYFMEKKEPELPKTFWTVNPEEEYIIDFTDIKAIYEIKAYVKGGGNLTVSIEDNGVWVDMFTIASLNEGWVEGERIFPDEEFFGTASIKLSGNGISIGELSVTAMDNGVFGEAEIDNIYKVVDVEKTPIEETDEINKCFDERDTLQETKAYPGGKSWNINSTADYVIADFGEIKNIHRGYYRTSLTNGTFGVYFSVDGTQWTKQNTVSVKEDMLYYWHNLSVYGEARYVLITAETPYLKLVEIGFFDSKDAEATIPIKELTVANENGRNLFDEQELVPPEGATYMNSMYFDEIYHARTAYESANGHSIYEWTHPPLGKDFMSWSVSTLGMTPFAWRLAGAVAGILMVPAMFFLGYLMFRKTSWATVTALLMAFDGMHYEQTRIATIDSFGVLFIILMFLFMYWYQSLSFYDVPLKKTFIPLGLCGLSFGLGASSKWICLYAGAGLAVIFFMTMIRRWREYSVAVNNLKKATGEERKYLQHIQDTCLLNTLYTLLFCIGVFIVLPLIIYCLSYYPYWNAETETRAWHDIILSNQEAMFDYHSNLTATHPFQSNWYTWPTMEKPMWFYSGPQDAENMSAIYAFGNPIVWWTGFVATLAGIGVLVSRLFGCKVTNKYNKPVPGLFRMFTTGEEGLFDNSERDTRTLLFLLIGVICNLIPWMGVSRCIFIYHYFATVPFIILFTVYMLRYISRYDVRIGAGITIGLSVLAIIAFLMFLPVWTGTSVSRDYVDTWLRWKDNWFVEYFPRG